MPTKRSRLLVLLALLAVAVVASAGLYQSGWFELGENEQIEPSDCPVCGKHVPFKTRKGRTHAECSECGAYERHRLLVEYLKGTEGLLAPGTRFLHFAPNRGVEAFVRTLPGLKYSTADLYARADLKLDLTAIDQPDASWDLIVGYHVLEHVDDDRKAMAELFRILAPGGRAVLQVPLQPGRELTYEDPSIVDPKQRLEHFGQEDHVRLYGVTDLTLRLESVGFRVEVVDYAAALGPEAIVAGRLTREASDAPPADERIWVAHRPGP